MATVKQVKAFAKENDLYAAWNNEWQEWTVSDGNGCDIYHTSDHEDAIEHLKYILN